LHQVGTSSLLIYMMHGHTYIKFACVSVYGIVYCDYFCIWQFC